MALSILMGLNSAYATDPSQCRGVIGNMNVQRAKEFMDRYGEPEVLDRALAAARIKQKLTKLGVVFEDLHQDIIIKPIPKAGLNQFAYEMNRFNNMRVAMNMHSYSDRTTALRDDYFQAFSGSYYSNLILSEAFLDEVVAKDFNIDTWLNNAKTYLKAYRTPNDPILKTIFLSQNGRTLDFAKLIEDHREAIENDIFSLAQTGRSDGFRWHDTLEDLAKFGMAISDLRQFIEPILEQVGGRMTISLNPFDYFRDPLHKNMDLNFVEAGSNKYKVLVSVRDGKGSTISFYLHEDIQINDKNHLSKDDWQNITGRARVHLHQLYTTIVGLDSLARFTAPKTVDDVRAYLQSFIRNSSIEPKEFIY
jgi:hypothetical protein